MPVPMLLTRLLAWVESLRPAAARKRASGNAFRLFSRRKVFKIQKAILVGHQKAHMEPQSLDSTLRDMQQRITDLERALKFQMLLPRKVAALRRQATGLTGTWAPMDSHRMQREMQTLKQWLCAESQDGCTIPDAAYYQQCPPDYHPLELQDWYQRRTKRLLNLEQPRTFNEKIQWLKLYDATSLKTMLADKFAVRDWVSGKIGSQYLVPLIGVYDTAEEIPFHALPERFVIKATHGSDMNLIVTDKNRLNWEEAKQRIHSWLQRNHAFEHGLEMHYAPIVPRILVEDYLESGPGLPEDRKKPPYTMDDYKVWCFGGKAHYIQFATGHVTAFYNTRWEKQDFSNKAVRQAPCPRPDCLEELLQRAETLAEGFAFVRVDFYILLDGSLKFGEMTFTSSSGTAKWNPPSADELLGSLITLPSPTIPG